MKTFRAILPMFFYILLAAAGVLYGSVSTARAEYDLTLAWDESIDGSSYHLFMHEEGDTYDFGSPLWEGSELACTVMSLREGTVYYFVVRAVDAEGRESSNSNEVRYPPAEGGGGGGGGGGCFITASAE